MPPLPIASLPLASVTFCPSLIVLISRDQGFQNLNQLLCRLLISSAIFAAPALSARQHPARLRRVRTGLSKVVSITHRHFRQCLMRSIY